MRRSNPGATGMISTLAPGLLPLRFALGRNDAEGVTRFSDGSHYLRVRFH